MTLDLCGLKDSELFGVGVCRGDGSGLRPGSSRRGGGGFARNYGAMGVGCVVAATTAKRDAGGG